MTPHQARLTKHPAFFRMIRNMLCFLLVIPLGLWLQAAPLQAASVTPVAGDLIFNEYAGDNDANGNDFVELLVLKDGLDLRGLRISDNELVSGQLNNGEAVLVFGNESYLQNVPKGTLLAVWTTDVGVTVDTTTNPAANDWKMVLAPGTGITVAIDGLGGSVNAGLSTSGEALYLYLSGLDGTSAGTDNVYLDFLSYETDGGDAPSGLVDVNLAVPADNAYYTGNTAAGNDTVSNWTTYDGAPNVSTTPGEPNPGQDLSSLRTATDSAPTVASTNPANNATNVSVNADLNLTFSEAVNPTGNWFTITCGTSGVHTAVVSGGPTAFTLNPDTDFATGESCTVTVAASLVSDQDADDPPDTMAADYSFAFATTGPGACAAPDTAIHAIQGAGNTAAITGTVTVQGVVVGDDEGAAPALRGFYLQDQNPDADPATSEGIFVFNGNNNNVSLGQVVQVTGVAAEFQDQTQLSAASIEQCGTTANITPVDVTLPVPAPENGVPYLERYEGMLVRFPQTLYVTEHFQLGRFGQIVMSSGKRLPQPTNLVAPGAPAQAQQAANDLNQIIVDDDLQNQNPDPIVFGRGGNPLSAGNTLRGGDSTTGLVGVLSYTWAGNAASGNAYRLRPLNTLGGGVPHFQATDPRPAGPPTAGGRLKVASFNVLNYFLTLDVGTQANCGPLGFKQACRGAETAEELTRQQNKLNQALLKLNADVVGLMELENTQNAQGQDVNPLSDIVSRLNTSLGSDVYGQIDTGAIGTDTIRVGLIYKKAAVTPVNTPLVDNNPIHNRPPVAQLFSENSTGERFTVIVNHFKSKGSCPTDPADPNNDQGDGQSCWNVQRVQQAQALAAFISGTVLPTTGDPDVLLIGDFNSYAKEDPIQTLETVGYTNLVARFGGAAAYSYVFDGQWGYLDQGLASASLLAQVTGAGDYHINADEPSVLDYNTNFKSVGQVTSLYNADEFRTSDHDPVVIGLSLHPLPQANADAYIAEANSSLTVTATQGLFANDGGAPLTIISSTAPLHGALLLNADGSFVYTPTTDYTGTDSFVYTVTNAAQLYTTHLPPLGTFGGGVNVTGDGYGSALYPVPGSIDEYYGLTDRGPNVDGPNGTKIEPAPTFVPALGKFKFSNGQAILEQVIPLQAADGTPYSGRVSTAADTGETITDLDGNVLAKDPNGYDSEGLVALPDGTFWISDEYGPFITHFDASGKQLARLSPFDHSLPAELANRVVNRGMEGLAITPDGSTLVGMMQSALQQTDLAGFDAKKLTVLRIVTYKLADGELHEYVYLLDNPSTTKTAVSEITALSNTTFLVDERDGNFLPGAYKKIYKIDLSSATDIGPNSAVTGTTYDAANGGLLIGGKTLELLVKNQNTVTSTLTLANGGITPVSKSLYLDVTALLTTLDPQARFFAHDKLEGIAVIDNGTKLVLSNDSDFGIDGISNDAPPFQLHAKIVPTTGQQDKGEFLVVDLTKLPGSTSSATVTINTVDASAPETIIDSQPVGLSDSSNATFTFHGTDAGPGVVTFACSLDNAAYTPCTSPVDYHGLAEGSHTFAVKAIDAADNNDATPAVYTWIVQTTPPGSVLYFPVIRR